MALAVIHAAFLIGNNPSLRIQNNTSCVYHEAINKANATGIIFLGDFNTLGKCTDAVLSFQNATAFTWFQTDFMKSNKWSSGCYARTDGEYTTVQKKLVISGIVTNRPTPPPAPAPPTRNCKSDMDCSLNGVCSLETPRTCVCDVAWIGSSCAQFNFMPGSRNSGYRNINIGGPYNNLSSWGGGGWYDPDAKKWYMWATELADHCGEFPSSLLLIITLFVSHPSSSFNISFSKHLQACTPGLRTRKQSVHLAILVLVDTFVKVCRLGSGATRVPSLGLLMTKHMSHTFHTIRTKVQTGQCASYAPMAARILTAKK